LLCFSRLYFSFFFFTHPATTEIYTLSLHDALPILASGASFLVAWPEYYRRSPDAADRRYACHSRALPSSNDPTPPPDSDAGVSRSEEHTSELQSPCNLVCRLLLEKKKKKKKNKHYK